MNTARILDFKNKVLNAPRKKPSWMEDTEAEEESNVIEADEECAQKVEDYLILKEEKDRIEQQMERLKEDLRLKLESEGAEVLQDCFGNKLCSYKAQVTNRFDTALFKQNNPEVYQSYLKQSHTRVFRI